MGKILTSENRTQSHTHTKKTSNCRLCKDKVVVDEKHYTVYRGLIYKTVKIKNKHGMIKSVRIAVCIGVVYQ